MIKAMNRKFENDLERLYTLVGMRQKELGSYFSIVENKRYDKGIERFIDTFLHELELSLV